jgi:hypothetical protein
MATKKPMPNVKNPSHAYELELLLNWYTPFENWGKQWAEDDMQALVQSWIEPLHLLFQHRPFHLGVLHGRRCRPIEKSNLAAELCAAFSANPQGLTVRPDRLANQTLVELSPTRVHIRWHEPVEIRVLLERMRKTAAAFMARPGLEHGALSEREMFGSLSRLKLERSVPYEIHNEIRFLYPAHIQWIGPTAFRNTNAWKTWRDKLHSAPAKQATIANEIIELDWTDDLNDADCVAHLDAVREAFWKERFPIQNRKLPGLRLRLRSKKKLGSEEKARWALGVSALLPGVIPRGDREDLNNGNVRRHSHQGFLHIFCEEAMLHRKRTWHIYVSADGLELWGPETEPDEFGPESDRFIELAQRVAAQMNPKAAIATHGYRGGIHDKWTENTVAQLNFLPATFFEKRPNLAGRQVGNLIELSFGNLFELIDAKTKNDVQLKGLDFIDVCE